MEVYDQQSNPIANTENESDICYGDVPVKIAFYPAKAVAHRCMLDFFWYLDWKYINNIHVDGADNGQYTPRPRSEIKYH